MAGATSQRKKEKKKKIEDAKMRSSNDLREYVENDKVLHYNISYIKCLLTFIWILVIILLYVFTDTRVSFLGRSILISSI